ncbi:MAG: 50S ribosomal protein L21 [Candidatus Uhrbacteria bacterium]|nr:50S ribosomal protein L21 [Candidatus Uhrbacteria bacterium]
MIAVIKTGGKQYIIKEGEMLKIEKLALNEGDTAQLTEVLLTADDDGGNVEIGIPTLSNKVISAEVIEQGRGKKVTVIKYKPKVRYRRKVGHRQPFTKLKIVKA